MRLGTYPCELKAGTKAAEAYGTSRIDERHRHRFEVNNAYREQLERAGMVLSGLSPDGRLVEMIELPDGTRTSWLPVPPRVQERGRARRTRCSRASSGPPWSSRTGARPRARSRGGGRGAGPVRRNVGSARG
jgi:hypothetical protein